MTDTVPADRAIALVTGANKGIGREIVARLAGMGMTVLLASRNPLLGEQTAEALRSIGGDVCSVQLDVTVPRTVEAVAALVGDRFGRLDVLVNNAGISGDLAKQTPSTADLSTVREVFDTNVLGVISVTNAMIPLLLRSPAGRIVNVTSGLGSLTRMSARDDYFTTRPASAAYVPSKTALNSLTVQYAKQLQGHGILVNAADPGPCATDFTRAYPGLPRTAADGAVVAVRLATLGANGPTGGFFNEDGSVPW